MKTTEDLKNAKHTSGQGLGKSTKPQSSSTQERTSPATPAVAEAKEHALQFMGAAQNNIAAQLQQKAGFLQNLDEMLDKAVVAIATAEQDILSGTALERKLAEQRSAYAYGAIDDAAVSIEFEALTTLEAIAKPQRFPALDDALKCISPADKARLDQAVLAPVK